MKKSINPKVLLGVQRRFSIEFVRNHQSESPLLVSFRKTAYVPSPRKKFMAITKGLQGNLYFKQFVR